MGFFKRNNALALNPSTANGKTADISQTVRGSDFYFAISAIMALSAFTFIGLGFRKLRRDRLFHYITAAVCFVASIAYFTMGANLGFTPVLVEFTRSDPRVHGLYRQVFYARYIDWFITTPLLLLDLLLTAAMPWPTIFMIIAVDWIMIITGLIGALVVSRYKWGYFVFGCAALVYIVYHLAWESRRHAGALGADVKRAFFFCGSLTALLWVLYPIAWGLCEGGNYISPDSEAVFYGVLDFLAKPVFGALLVWSHRNIELNRLGLRIQDYEGDVEVHGAGREKTHAGNTGVTAGNDYGTPVNTTHGTAGVANPTTTTV